MSRVFNMVGGGSGGSLKDTDAILTVTVPTGSTVTAVKGGVTLTPTMWVQAANVTQDCALFVIAPTQFDSVNPWTVTATLGTDSATATVLINSNKQYDMELSYHYYLYNRGNQYTDITGGYYSTGSTVTIEPTKIHFTGSLDGYVLWSQNQISRGNFTKLVVKIENESFGTTTYSGLAIGFYATRSTSSQTPFVRVNQGGEQSLDISSVTNNRYIILYMSQTGEYCDVTQIWLE